MENKRLKHGLISVAITAGVLAAVLVFNIVFSLLASKFLWVIDTTPSDLVTISDYSKELLRGVDEDENDITIYFLADPDELENYELWGHQKGENGNTWGMSYIYNLAKLYEREFDYVKVALLDASDDADYIREHFAMSIGTSLGPLNIIMENRVGDRTTYRTMSRDDFFTLSTDLMYFRGDDKFTSTILSLSGESPVAYFVEGHGEDIGPLGDNADFGKASALVELFTEAGFVIEKIDLSKRDFPASEDDALYGRAGIVVLFGTDSDFKVEGEANEITRLRRYLNRKNHNLMVFMDPETEKTPHLDEYLEDFWGITFEDNILTVDTKDPISSGALTDDGRNYYARYETNTLSPGYALTSSLLSLETLPRSFFGKSRTIRMNPQWSTSKESVIMMEGITSYKLGAAYLAPALSYTTDSEGRIRVFDEELYGEFLTKYEKTILEEKHDEYTAKYYQAAYDRHMESYKANYEKDGLSEAEIAEKCASYAKDYVDSKIMDENLKLAASSPSPVMTLTHGSWMYQPGESVACYALACGSTDYASEEAIGNASFSNRDTLSSAIYLFGKNVLPYDIEVIRIESPSSLAIKDGMITLWTVILAVILPLCAAGVGVYVTVKRRRHN